MIPKFYGTVKNGRFKFASQREQDNYSLYLGTLDKCYVELVIKKRKRTRTLNQNRYYWGVIVKLLSNHTGYSDDEMHEALKSLFLSHPMQLASRNISVNKSTASLSTKEFEDYMDQIRGWAQVELNCYIPLPNEVEYD